MPSCRLSLEWRPGVVALAGLVVGDWTVPSCTRPGRSGRCSPGTVDPFELELEVLARSSSEGCVAVACRTSSSAWTRVPACGTPPTRHAEGNSCGRQFVRSTSIMAPRGSLGISPRSHLFDDAVHGLAHPGVVAYRACPRPSSSPSTCISSHASKLDNRGIRHADRPRAVVAPCWSSRAGTTTAGSRNSPVVENVAPAHQ